MLAVVDRDTLLRDITAHLTDICKTHAPAPEKRVASTTAAQVAIAPLVEPAGMPVSESSAAISTLAPLLAAEPSSGFWSRSVDPTGSRALGTSTLSDKGRPLEDDSVTTLSGGSDRDRGGSLAISADVSDLNEAKVKAAEADEAAPNANHAAQGRARGPALVAEWSPTNGMMLKHKRGRFAIAAWQRRFFKFTRDCHLVWAKTKDAAPMEWKEGAFGSQCELCRVF